MHQIIGRWDNLGIFFHISAYKSDIVLTPYTNRLNETVLEKYHNITFIERQENISMNYPQNFILSIAKVHVSAV